MSRLVGKVLGVRSRGASRALLDTRAAASLFCAVVMERPFILPSKPLQVPLPRVPFCLA